MLATSGSPTKKLASKARPKFAQLNDRLNAVAMRPRANSITSRVDTVRFRVDHFPFPFYEARDIAELHLVRYLEADPFVESWSRRKHPFHWSAGGEQYQTHFPFEVWMQAGGPEKMHLYAIVDEGITGHPLWRDILQAMRLSMRAFLFVLDGDGIPMLSEDVALAWADRDPWTLMTSRVNAELLLQHRSTNQPALIAAIEQLLTASSSWMSVREIVNIIDQPGTYSQVMQMIWACKLWRRDSEAPLGMGTYVYLWRNR